MSPKKSARLKGLAVALLLTAIAGAARSENFYIFKQWNSSVGDIDGKVGYPLNVDGPTAQGCAGSWSSRPHVAEGSLPPGMSLQNNSDVSGIPTERGHWIVTMEMSNIACGGQAYPLMTFKQQLRFHITGTGEVH
jgi:hypothetical protein